MTRKIIPCIACLASASLQDPDDFIRGARARPQISLANRVSPGSRVPGPRFPLAARKVVFRDDDKGKNSGQLENFFDYGEK